jgi:hypothetical protein
MRKIVICAALSVPTLVGCGATPPKSLMAHNYATDDKSVETLIQQSGAALKEGNAKTNLFNVILRVCNQSPRNEQSACKDTVVLENVHPGSI